MGHILPHAPVTHCGGGDFGVLCPGIGALPATPQPSCAGTGRALGVPGSPGLPRSRRSGAFPARRKAPAQG
ncbi:hypothetical protein GCM10009863_25580 [Streptomyces axinellae]|uniref:Uncharacterized protein n=1 Tax=Streptomyces axinellae TaxID=552788 RepID=A0ABN3Q051_9ACTN